MAPEQPLRVVADRAVAGIAEAAQTLADRVEVRLLSSAEIDAAAVRDADLLFVRSTVRCGEGLLRGSRVRFLGTATIGTDHLDLPWLAQAGITWANAPGCNADAVAHWLAAALCRLLTSAEAGAGQGPSGPPLAGRRAGVVGLGNVGDRAARLLRALGAEVLVCDPPRARQGLPGGPYLALDALCGAGLDLITLHVPLVRAGADRTVDLLDGRRRDLLPPGAVIVNSCRGEVLAEEVLRDPRGRTLICDVFPGEPALGPDHVARCLLATPHIAGHSLEGKVRGTVLVYEAACRFLGVPPRWRPGALLPPSPLDGAAVPVRGRGDLAALADLVGRLYDIGADDAALRRIVALPPPERAGAFRRYREAYPLRRELTGARLTLDEERPVLRAALAALGARVEPALTAAPCSR